MSPQAGQPANSRRPAVVLLARPVARRDQAGRLARRRRGLLFVDGNRSGAPCRARAGRRCRAVAACDSPTSPSWPWLWPVPPLPRDQLEGPPLSMPDASPVYFAAIVLVGSVRGPWPALVAAVGAFGVYDLLFTEPRLTLVVEDPREWLDLVLFLVLAIVVGRLAALGTSGPRKQPGARRRRQVCSRSGGSWPRRRTSRPPRRSSPSGCSTTRVSSGSGSWPRRGGRHDRWLTPRATEPLPTSLSPSRISSGCRGRYAACAPSTAADRIARGAG